MSQLLGRFGLKLAAVALAAVALLLVVSVEAFRAAQANSAANVAVVSTDTALLALAPCQNSCGANRNGIAALSGGQLTLDFRKGAGGSNFGVQSGATYTFKELVWATNNAGRSVNVTASVTGGSPDLVSVKDQNGNVLVGSGAGTVTVASGAQLKLDFTWQGSSSAGTSRSVQLALSAR